MVIHYHYIISAITTLLCRPKGTGGQSSCSKVREQSGFKTPVDQIRPLSPKVSPPLKKTIPPPVFHYM